MIPCAADSWYIQGHRRFDTSGRVSDKACRGCHNGALVLLAEGIPVSMGLRSHDPTSLWRFKWFKNRHETVDGKATTVQKKSFLSTSMLPLGLVLLGTIFGNYYELNVRCTNWLLYKTVDYLIPWVSTVASGVPHRETDGKEWWGQTVPYTVDISKWSELPWSHIIELYIERPRHGTRQRSLMLKSLPDGTGQVVVKWWPITSSEECHVMLPILEHTIRPVLIDAESLTGSVKNDSYAT